MGRYPPCSFIGFRERHLLSSGVYMDQSRFLIEEFAVEVEGGCIISKESNGEYS